MIHAVIDTETTGLIQNSAIPLDKQPRIIEFSGLLIEDDGTILEEIDFLCDPGIKLDDVIKKITGIKDEDLKGKKKFAEYFDDVNKFFSKAGVVVAHNLSYDFSLVNFEAKRIGKEIKWPEKKICTVEATEHIKGYRLNQSLLYKHLFNEEFAGAHRAMSDVKALTRCYVELLKKGIV